MQTNTATAAFPASYSKLTTELKDSEYWTYSAMW